MLPLLLILIFIVPCFADDHKDINTKLISYTKTDNCNTQSEHLEVKDPDTGLTKYIIKSPCEEKAYKTGYVDGYEKRVEYEQGH